MLRKIFTPAMTLALAQSMSLEDHASTLTQIDMPESKLAPETLTLAQDALSQSISSIDSYWAKVSNHDLTRKCDVANFQGWTWNPFIPKNIRDSLESGIIPEAFLQYHLDVA